MDRLHARYPFLSAAREAVEAAAVDLAELVARESAPAVERAVERVDTAIAEGRVGDPHRRPRVELLSYPVARVLVSLVDDPALTRAYARAEAATAVDRLAADMADVELKSTRRERLDVETLLREFDLASAVEETTDREGYRVAVGPYLRLSGDLSGEAWRLTNRHLHDGWVPVTEEELRALLRQAIEERVAEGLPLGVPASIADPLADEVATVRAALASPDYAHDVRVVAPDLFPPCIAHLVDRVGAGESLEDHGQFALVSFLASIGADADEVVALTGAEGETAEDLRYARERLGDDDGAAYTPPSCATMQAYGDCVNKDDLCAEISSPLGYYQTRVERDGVEE